MQKIIVPLLCIVLLVACEDNSRKQRLETIYTAIFFCVQFNRNIERDYTQLHTLGVVEDIYKLHQLLQNARDEPYRLTRLGTTFRNTYSSEVSKYGINLGDLASEGRNAANVFSRANISGSPNAREGFWGMVQFCSKLN
ncbi:MAG: hypothetical protein COA52_15960 [Hyphomicrobiales bacterium]|nr:MAG: hypothetical protein COA52_15960 [Hyphomicrobiales bacterium]